MGTASPHIKTLISLAYNYQIRGTEKNLGQLQRQLQILSVISDLSIFEPTCMEILEFYVCLEQLLSSSDSRSSLTWKIISLFIHISRSPNIRIAMRDEIQLVPVLSQHLIELKQSKHKSQTLQLLRDISYGIKINRREAWMMKLVSHLVFIVLECEGQSDNAEVSICTLANLCRGNSSAIATCKEIKERKSFLKLLTDLKGRDIKFQLLVAEIFIHMNLDHSKLVSEQIMRTFKLLFMVVTEGFVENNEETLRLSKDVSEEIISKPELQESLKGFNEFGSYCQNLLENIKEKSEPNCVGFLFDFLASVICLEHPELNNLIPLLFNRVLQWLPNQNCGLGGLKLLYSLVGTTDDTVIASYIDNLVSSLKEALVLREDFTPSTKDAEWINSSLCLLEAISNRDPSFHFKLAKAFAPPTLSSLLKPFLEVKNSKMSYFSEDEGMVNGNSGGLFMSSMTSSLSTSLPRNFSETKKTNRKNVFDIFAEVVVRVVSVIKLLSSHEPEFKIECRQVLSNEKVMEHLVCCQRSSNLDLVSRSTNILCQESIPSENFSALIKAQNEANFRNGCTTETEVANNPFHLTTSMQGSNFSHSIEDNIYTLTEKLNGAVEKSGLKDIPLTDVMSLYEYSLASRAHAEKSLQDALEASNLQNRQIQQRLLQARTESERLREFLHLWEGRLQQAQREKQEVENQVTEIKNSSRKFREGLIKEKTQVERELAQRQAEVSTARQEIESKDVAIKNLKRQLNDASADIKTWKDKERKLQDTVQKLEEEQKKTKREVEDQLKENNRLDKSVYQLKKENGELEMLIRSHEQTLAEKETQIEELTKVNASLKRIQDMIHNISSGKP